MSATIARPTWLAEIADPVESIRRVRNAICRQIGAHIESCQPCQRRQPCPVRARLDAEEAWAFDALERAREAHDGR